VSGIFRISIRARLIAMLFACNLIPFFSILTSLWLATRSGREAAVILQELKAAREMQHRLRTLNLALGQAGYPNLSH